MTEYERLSISLARWLTTAGEIEEIIDDMDRTAQRADISDDEYMAVCLLRDCARMALDGWSKADEALRKLTLAQGRSRQ
jgi:hypothetical protein